LAGCARERQRRKKRRVNKAGFARMKTDRREEKRREEKKEM